MNRKILLIMVILIFLLFSSWNFSNFIIDKRYNKASGVTDEIASLKEKHQGDTETYEKLTDIEESVSFLQGACLE